MTKKTNIYDSVRRIKSSFNAQESISIIVAHTVGFEISTNP